MSISTILRWPRRLISWPFRHWRFFLLLLIVAAIVHTIADQILLRKLARQREAIVSAGGKASLAEYDLKLDHSANAAPVYEYAATKKWSPDYPLFDKGNLLYRYVQMSHPRCGAVPDDGRKGEKNEPLSAEEEDLVAEFIRRNEPVYALLQEAGAKPACQFVDYSTATVSTTAPDIMPKLAFLRELARRSWVRAVWEARQGNKEGACLWSTQTLRLSNALQNDPLLIAALVRAAIIGLANEAIWSTVCADGIPQDLPPALLEELDTASRRDLWARHYDAERCYSNALLQEQYMHIGRLIRPIISTPNQLRINDLMQSVIACVQEEPFPARKARQDQIAAHYGLETDAKSAKPWRVLSDLMSPAITQTISTIERAIVQAEGARVLLLLGRYHGEHGAYPNALEDLVPGEIATLPEDPFSGKPFCYRVEGQGFVLYSVGEDGKDDRGTPSVKRGPGDIVWCVTGY